MNYARPVSHSIFSCVEKLLRKVIHIIKSVTNDVHVDDALKSISIVLTKEFYIYLFQFRVTTPGHQGYLGATVVTPTLSDWQALGIELCMTFVITLVYLVYNIY